MCSWAYDEVRWQCDLLQFADDDTDDDDGDVCVVGRMVKYTGCGNCSGLLMMTHMMVMMMIMYLGS